MKTVNIKGKEYVPVNERLKEFRKQYPKYSLRTELVNVDESVALVKGVIRDEQDRIIAEGTAHERADQKGSMVNSTSHVENAETSAWGRALGNLGIGIDASVATADEVANAVANQNSPAPRKYPPKKPTLEFVLSALDNAKDAKELFALSERTRNYDWSIDARDTIRESLSRNMKRFPSGELPMTELASEQ